MKTFHVNQEPGVKIVPVLRNQGPLGACRINEIFSVGTRNGIQHGKAGDYLLVSEAGMQAISEVSFTENYEVVKPGAIADIREAAKILKVRNYNNTGAVKLIAKIITATEKNILDKIKAEAKKVPVKKVEKAPAKKTVKKTTKKGK